MIEIRYLHVDESIDFLSQHNYTSDITLVGWFDRPAFDERRIRAAINDNSFTVALWHIKPARTPISERLKARA